MSTPLAPLHSSFATAVSIVANDNEQGPPTKGDRWPWLINRLREINEPLGVCAAQYRLEGMVVEEFCEIMLLCDRLNSHKRSLLQAGENQ